MKLSAQLELHAVEDLKDKLTNPNTGDQLVNKKQNCAVPAGVGNDAS